MRNDLEEVEGTLRLTVRQYVLVRLVTRICFLWEGCLVSVAGCAVCSGITEWPVSRRTRDHNRPI
jgi:hypothetical protein